MLDAGRGGADCSSPFDFEPDRSPKRQYTLKGVEAEAIELMRDAARTEGMKIGSWVSLRMREAAEKALNQKSTRLNAQQQGAIVSQEELVRELSARVSSLEQEIRELTKTQMAVMARIITQG